ncbi:MAG TPA: hypothetical protein VM529_13565 [Gemmata sp.]|jgi:hypothetical protein|nr:hypothetical protein [Gemmata sp.]
MNANFKAPAGGLVSAVNGQFYEGGQFVPEHGLYCGRSGAKRRKAVERSRGVGRVYGDEATAAKVFEVERRGGFPWAGVAFADSAAHAVAVVAAAGVAGNLVAREVY